MTYEPQTGHISYLAVPMHASYKQDRERDMLARSAAQNHRQALTHRDGLHRRRKASCRRRSPERTARGGCQLPRRSTTYVLGNETSKVNGAGTLLRPAQGQRPFQRTQQPAALEQALIREMAVVVNNRTSFMTGPRYESSGRATHSNGVPISYGRQLFNSEWRVSIRQNHYV